MQKIKVIFYLKECYVTYPNECEACKASSYYKKNKCDFYKKIIEKNY